MDLLAVPGIRSEGARQGRSGLVRQRIHQGAVEAVGAGVVELGRNGAEDGQAVVLRLPEFVVALVLLADVAQGIGASALVELVDGHHISEVEHVDLLQLRSGAEFRGHHVQRHVAVVHDFRVALADAGRLQNDEVKTGRFEDAEGVAHVAAQGEVGLACGEGPHVHAARGDGVHPDAVAEQGAARFPLGGVDRHDGHPLVLEVEEEAPDQLVDEGTLSRTACAGDAEDRDGRRVGSGPDAVEDAGVGLRSNLGGRDEPGQIPGGLVRQAVGLTRRLSDHWEVATPDDVIDHALQAHFPAVVRVVDALDAVVVELGNLLGENGAASAAEDADVPGPALIEQVLHVFKVLHVASLVGGHGDGLRVFLNGTIHHLIDRTVMAEVNDLASRALQDAPHDVDGGIVAVEEGGGGDDADRMARAGGFRFLRVLRLGGFHARFNGAPQS